MREACIESLKDVLHSLKRIASIGGDMEVLRRKVADVRGHIKSLVNGLGRRTFKSCVRTYHNVDQSLLVVSCCLRDVDDPEPKELQRSDPAALRDALDGDQELFVGAPEVVDKSLSLNFKHSEWDESARPGSLSAHLANREQRRSRTRAASDSGVHQRTIHSKALGLLLLARQILLIILVDDS